MQNNAESYIDNNHKSLRVFLYAQRVMKGWNQNIQEENVFKLEKDIGDGALRKLIKHNGERHKVVNLTAILVRSVWCSSEQFQKTKAKLIHTLITQQVRKTSEQAGKEVQNVTS